MEVVEEIERMAIESDLSFSAFLQVEQQLTQPFAQLSSALIASRNNSNNKK
jgi:hypothetical protein